MLVVLNVPMIGVWVKLLTVPYRYLYPGALFFICIGVYSTNNDLFDVGETLVFGIVGYLLLRLRLPAGADSARLRARAALGGEFPPRDADLRRRSSRSSSSGRSAPRSSALAAILIMAQIFFHIRKIWVTSSAPITVPAAAMGKAEARKSPALLGSRASSISKNRSPGG